MKNWTRTAIASFGFRKRKHKMKAKIKEKHKVVSLDKRKAQCPWVYAIHGIFNYYVDFKK